MLLLAGANACTRPNHWDPLDCVYGVYGVEKPSYIILCARYMRYASTTYSAVFCTQSHIHEQRALCLRIFSFIFIHIYMMLFLISVWFLVVRTSMWKLRQTPLHVGASDSICCVFFSFNTNKYTNNNTRTSRRRSKVVVQRTSRMDEKKNPNQIHHNVSHPAKLFWVFRTGSARYTCSRELSMWNRFAHLGWAC